MLENLQDKYPELMIRVGLFLVCGVLGTCVMLLLGSG